MARCNTQANDMATTANDWKTPGASESGRYTKKVPTREDATGGSFTVGATLESK